MRLAFLGIQLLDGFETTTDNIRGRLPELMEAAGFREVRVNQQFMTALGPISLYAATTG